MKKFFSNLFLGKRKHEIVLPIDEVLFSKNEDNFSSISYKYYGQQTVLKICPNYIRIVHNNSYFDYVLNEGISYEFMANLNENDYANDDDFNRVKVSLHYDNKSLKINLLFTKEVSLDYKNIDYIYEVPFSIELAVDKETNDLIVPKELFSYSLKYNYNLKNHFFLYCHRSYNLGKYRIPLKITDENEPIERIMEELNTPNFKNSLALMRKFLDLNNIEDQKIYKFLECAYREKAGLIIHEKCQYNFKAILDAILKKCQTNHIQIIQSLAEFKRSAYSNDCQKELEKMHKELKKVGIIEIEEKIKKIIDQYDLKMKEEEMLNFVLSIK